MDQEQPRTYTRADADRLFEQRRNWGRWGGDDERGAVRLITDEVRVAAAALVRTGRTVSLARPFPKDPDPSNERPALHYMNKLYQRGEGGAATDFYGISYHGLASTHIDALCHIWDTRGMWNGRDPAVEITLGGATWAGIQNWSDGMVTRGVLLDVARHRNGSPPTVETPVHGWELAEICRARGVEVRSGDALVVHCGREVWERQHGRLWGTPEGQPRPGLHASCMEFIRDHDCSLLVWDMMDALPSDLGLPWPVHGALSWFGVGLVDNAYLAPLVEASAELGRDEFMFVVAPLRVEGGTGSPVNPLAVF